MALIKTEIELYHITTQDKAKSILTNGFLKGRTWFTTEIYLKYWLDNLELPKKQTKIAVIKITISQKFYQTEFFNWDQDPFSQGPAGQITYGEGPQGWNNPMERPALKNIPMRILGSEEIKKILNNVEVAEFITKFILDKDASFRD